MPLLGTQPGGNRSGPWTPGTAPGARMTPSLARRCWSEWAGPRARWVLGLPTDCLTFDPSWHGCKYGICWLFFRFEGPGQKWTRLHWPHQSQSKKWQLWSWSQCRWWGETSLTHSLTQGNSNFWGNVQYAVIVYRFAMMLSFTINTKLLSDTVLLYSA